MGIYRVQLANLDTTTNGSADGYRDYSCLRRARMLRGSTYTLRVQTGPSAAENVVAWVDYNNDGSFDPSERIMYSLNAQAHAASFTVPLTATLNQPLRLRIAADYVNAAIPSACSTPQYSQTEDYQVRLAVGNAAPVARFTSPDTITCSGAVSFRDASLNSPTAWRWQFGDGSTSTQQHPSHTYATAGTYAVRLRVCNAGGCDSLTRPAYVTVRTNGPRAISCQSVTAAYCCQFGITRVRLAGLDHASADGQAGYEDFSCAFRATLTADQPYSLQLATGPSAHDVRVYLDLNDDGQFTPATELLYQGLAVQSPVIPFSVASIQSPVYGRPLRLRIVAAAAGTANAGPCGPVQSGQAEDYTLTLVPNGVRPTAGFTLEYQQFCGPVRVAVVNTTTGGATSYAWDFGDGSTDTQATPAAHSYVVAGVYEVRLVAQNAFGRDTARYRVAVATNCPSYCAATGYGGTVTGPAYFTRFQVAGLNNTDFRGPGVGYRDFTARSATVQAGQSYQVRAESLPYTFASSGPWNAVEVWVDFNQDGQLSESERTGPLTQFSPHQLTLRIPGNARAGATRMRAIIHQGNQTQAPASCTPSFLSGAVEDYTLVILPPPVPPRPGFFADQPAACNGMVQFRDTSWSAPSSWAWTFGDGSTSTLQHPQHQYAVPGTYTVTLQAANSYGARTITRASYVTVSSLAAGPRPAVCLPVPVFGTTIGQHGIDTLRIGSVFSYHQPWNSPGYRDETCSRASIALAQGGQYRVRFVDSNPYGAACYLWLDINNNGAFESPAELLFYSTRAALSSPGGIISSMVVPTTAVTGQPLRMRVAQWSFEPSVPLPPVPSPCLRDEIIGQVRDFTVVVTAPLAAGVEKVTEAKWQIAPNPTTGFATIHGSFLRPTAVSLSDMLGRSVYRAEVMPDAHNALVLDLRLLPRGMYLVHTADSNQIGRLVLE